MNIINRTVNAIVTFFAPAKTTTKFEDRVRDLVAVGNAEATAAYEKADTLAEMAHDITLAAGRSRSYARRINGLVGKLDAVVD